MEVKVFSSVINRLSQAAAFDNTVYSPSFTHLLSWDHLEVEAMSENDELKHVDSDGELEKQVDAGVIDIEASERRNGHIFSSKEVDWVDEHVHGFLGRVANFLVSWGVESRGMAHY